MASLLPSACLGTFVISLFNFLNYFVWLRITDEGSVPEMRIWSILLMKSDLKWCIHLDLFCIPTTSLTWWVVSLLVDQRVPEGTCSQILRSTSVDFVAFSRASKFSVLKFIEIVIFGVYSPSLLASVCFGTFEISLFNFFSYFVWPTKDHWWWFSTRNAHMLHIIIINQSTFFV